MELVTGIINLLTYYVIMCAKSTLYEYEMYAKI
jgi:hypothetical protein